jgi:hypothetical protein
VKFLHLKTARVITVDNWVKLPVPDTILEYLNSQAKKEKKKKVTRDPTFIRQGQRVASDDPDDPVPDMTRSNLSEYGRVIGLPVPNLEPIIHHPPRLHPLPGTPSSSKPPGAIQSH